MTTIDIFGIEETQISRDLKGKIVTIYGDPKTGKTTTATQFPKSLLIAFEKGFNALAGIKAQPIQKWTEFKKVLKQLENPKAKEMYETIIIDTADIAYDLVEKFVCQREGVDKIGDIPYGGGYKMVKDEFNGALRSIPMMDFGLVMISHAMSKNFTDQEGTEYSKIIPTLPERPRQIVLGMSDLIGYARTVEKEGEQQTVLFLRATPRFEAGSRFKYTPAVIRFNYDSLVNAIADAIEKEAEEKGAAAVTNDHINLYEKSAEVDFDSVQASAQEIAGKIAEAHSDKVAKVKGIIENHLGKGKAIKDCTEDQKDILTLVVDDLITLAAELKVEI